MTASHSPGRTRGRLSTRPPPVMCARPLSALAGERGEQRLVVAMHAQQLFADALFQARQLVPGAQAHRLEEHLARERVAVGVQAVGGEADDDVARLDARAVDHLRAIDHADDRAGEVVFAALIHARHLRGLAADERAAGFRAGFGEALDELLEDARLQPLGADVIEEKERPRADDGDVVDAMIHEVLADRVVAIERKGELQLRADAIDAGDEHRLLHSFEIRAEEAAETADLAEHLRPVRDLHAVVDAALHLVAEIHIHPRGGVRFFGRRGARGGRAGLGRHRWSARCNSGGGALPTLLTLAPREAAAFSSLHSKSAHWKLKIGNWRLVPCATPVLFDLSNLHFPIFNFQLSGK